MGANHPKWKRILVIVCTSIFFWDLVPKLIWFCLSTDRQTDRQTLCQWTHTFVESFDIFKEWNSTESWRSRVTLTACVLQHCETNAPNSLTNDSQGRFGFGPEWPGLCPFAHIWENKSNLTRSAPGGTNSRPFLHHLGQKRCKIRLNNKRKRHMKGVFCIGAITHNAPGGDGVVAAGGGGQLG